MQQVVHTLGPHICGFNQLLLEILQKEKKKSKEALKSKA